MCCEVIRLKGVVANLSSAVVSTQVDILTDTTDYITHHGLLLSRDSSSGNLAQCQRIERPGTSILPTERIKKR